MGGSARHDAWQAGDAYEQYMGRWSRKVASRFTDWLDAPDGLDWLEIGCGTGALTATLVSECNPRTVHAIEPSDGFLEKARRNVVDPRVTFALGDAKNLHFPEASMDMIVSGLVLNFISDPTAALAEMRRVARPDATIAYYVWDYPGGGVEFMRAFWSAAATLDPTASDLTEDRRFPFCTRDGLSALAAKAQLRVVDETALEVPTVFRDFDDFWRPFTLGAGPAPGYCASLADDARERLRSRLSDTLNRQADGSIHLRARAWALNARPG